MEACREVGEVGCILDRVAVYPRMHKRQNITAISYLRNSPLVCSLPNTVMRGTSVAFLNHIHTIGDRFLSQICSSCPVNRSDWEIKEQCMLSNLWSKAYAALSFIPTVMRTIIYKTNIVFIWYDLELETETVNLLGKCLLRSQAKELEGHFLIDFYITKHLFETRALLYFCEGWNE